MHQCVSVESDAALIVLACRHDQSCLLKHELNMPVSNTGVTNDWSTRAVVSTQALPVVMEHSCNQYRECYIFVSFVWGVVVGCGELLWYVVGYVFFVFFGSGGLVGFLCLLLGFVCFLEFGVFWRILAGFGFNWGFFFLFIIFY